MALQDDATAILQMRGITMKFPGVIALDDVSLDVRNGEIHAICGENGAGKSIVNMGLLAGVAGVVYSSRSNGAQPIAGNMFELDAIAACFIGGAAVSGGVGRISGAIIGGLTMAVMSNGMQLMGLPTSSQQIVKGLVLLLAVGFDVYSKRRGSAAL